MKRGSYVFLNCSLYSSPLLCSNLCETTVMVIALDSPWGSLYSEPVLIGVKMNQSVSYSELRGSLKSFLDKVCSEHLPLLVERKNGEDVVIVSKQDYASMEETSYLLSSPKNAERLLKALNRDPSKRVSFPSIEDVQNEVGL